MHNAGVASDRTNKQAPSKRAYCEVCLGAESIRWCESIAPLARAINNRSGSRRAVSERRGFVSSLVIKGRIDHRMQIMELCGLCASLSAVVVSIAACIILE